MFKLIAFAALSICFIGISWRSLRAPRSHGFYRFFAWEFILALLLLNLDAWFRNPFSWYQSISWFLLFASLAPLGFGVHSLVAHGKAVKQRMDEPQLLAFERTTALVDTGVYQYIRHPLYSSLLLMAWGIFFKSPSWPGAALALVATLFLFATAIADEAESSRFFGTAYESYMKQTKRFVPFLF